MAVKANLKAYLVMAVILLGFGCTIAAGEVIYVDADADPCGDGLSWATAYKYLQDGLAYANSNPDVNEIWVAEGTYYPDEDEAANVDINDRTETFQLISGVEIYGGFAGGGHDDPNVRLIHYYETILSGDIDVANDNSDNSYHVVIGSGTDANAVLDGFTVIAGNANGSSSADKRGGGMYNRSGSPTVNNCTFSANSAAGEQFRGGGGMYNRSSSPTVTSCNFRENSVGNYGGGISNYASQPTVKNCTFSGNSAAYGGGMYNYYESSPTVTNCTFSGNSASQSFGGGMFSKDDSDANLTNCILWGNEGSQIYDDGTSSATVSYSDVQGGWQGEGNIDYDPCFADPCKGDYRLKSEGWRWTEELIHDSHWYYDSTTSRCIDAGNPGSPLRDELMSVPDDPNNIWGENIRINMGAYGGTAEASMPPYDWALLADLTNDGTVDYVDLGYWVENWLSNGSELPSDLDRNGVVDMFDFALFGQDWCLETIWHE